jgi:PEP-CTERM motif-containing protein
MFRSRHAGAILGFVLAAALAACDPSDGSRGSSDPIGPPPHGDPTQPPTPTRGELPPEPPGRGPGEGPSAPPPPVPEPGTVLLVGSGLASMAMLARRRRRALAAQGQPEQK